MQHFIPLIAALWIGTDVSAFTLPLYHVRRIPMAMNAGNGRISRREILSVASAGAFMLASQPSMARLEGVNRPDLLPSEPGLNVIQVEKFLTTGQAKRMNDLLTALERDTGFRVRVLCQAYPNTPGLAVRDYWDLGKEVRESKYLYFSGWRYSFLPSPSFLLTIFRVKRTISTLWWWWISLVARVSYF